jgi:flavin reductase (DIM6/NTAB) family NADH-FMN oxidoreductase RutF
VVPSRRPDEPLVGSPVSDLQRAYRDTIGQFATGVAIVTTTGPDGPAGMTTNAVTSLSLDPLLLLVCFNRGSRTLDVVRRSRRFAVNVLAVEDRELAAVFASKRIAREKFESVTHTEAHGVPVLDKALTWIACELRELVPGGDHEIGIGEVIGLGPLRDGDPLVYVRGRYTTIGS